MGKEARGLGVGEARGAHELEAGLVARGLGIGKVEAQVRGDRARHSQLVGEHVANQPRAVPGRPALRKIADRERAHVEYVGIDLADLGCAVDLLAGRTEPFGPQQDAVRVDLHLDVAAHRLVSDGVERIVADDVVARGRGRRGDVVDPPDQRDRIHLARGDPDRAEHRDEAVHHGDDFLGRDTRAFRRRIGNGDAVVAKTEWRIGRKRVPHAVREEVDPMLGHPLVDAARRVAGQIPFGEPLADPRAHPVVELQASGHRDALGQELCQDLAGTLIRPDERRDLDHESARGGVVEDARLRVVAAIGQPMREHRHGQVRTLGLWSLAIAEQTGEQVVVETGLYAHVSCPPEPRRGSSQRGRWGSSGS